MSDLRYVKKEEQNLCLVNTRFLMLKDGEIIFDGVDENLRQSQDEYIRRFLS
jgi:ABC-type transporter Mla maintaining outer membrane lipid asymmetry ATPase subunit MlaF